MATKEGSILLYNIHETKFTQQVSAHKKEIWELAMHTSPQIKKAKGQLLIASASAD